MARTRGFRVGEYFLFDPFSAAFEGYELDVLHGRYRPFFELRVIDAEHLRARACASVHAYVGLTSFAPKEIQTPANGNGHGGSGP